MIKSHNKVKLTDIQSGNHLEAEINWKEDDPLTNEGKVLKFKLPGGKYAYIKREEIVALAMVLGKREEVRNLIPQKFTKTRWYETDLMIKATKDVQKGEQIIFHVAIPLPDEREVGWGQTEQLPNKVANKLPSGIEIPKGGLKIK